MFERLTKVLGMKEPEPAPMGRIGIGPNGVEWQIRRAKWVDKERGIPLFDAEGNRLYEEKLEIYKNHNITCNTALSGAKDRLFNSATTAGITNFIVLSEGTGAMAATDTKIEAEITLSGLARATAAYSVGGCATGECILSKTFTATANVAAVVKMGLLDAASAGNLYFEATIVSVSLVTDDQLTAKWDKITLS